MIVSASAKASREDMPSATAMPVVMVGSRAVPDDAASRAG